MSQMLPLARGMDFPAQLAPASPGITQKLIIVPSCGVLSIVWGIGIPELGGNFYRY